MKRPAIFFDRDNTLIVSDGYLGDATQVQLIDGAADAVARARSMGFAVVTFSNQSGVARGMFGEEEVEAVNARLDELLRAANERAIIDRHEYCPFHPEGTVAEYCRDSDLRKPKPGMLLRAAGALHLDLSRSWVIGDAPRDVAAGRAAGCRAILVQDESLSPSPAAQEEARVEPDFIVRSLREAIDAIERQTQASSELANPSEPPSRLERLAEQILHELRRRHEHVDSDFSVPKLLAGIVQVLALAMLFLCYLYRADPAVQAMLMFTLILQTLVVALLLMGRNR